MHCIQCDSFNCSFELVWFELLKLWVHFTLSQKLGQYVLYKFYLHVGQNKCDQSWVSEPSQSVLCKVYPIFLLPYFCFTTTTMSRESTSWQPRRAWKCTPSTTVPKSNACNTWCSKRAFNSVDNKGKSLKMYKMFAKVLQNLGVNICLLDLLTALLNTINVTTVSQSMYMHNLVLLRTNYIVE